MIDKNEIDAKAEELGVHAANVQRDYVFGWLLSGLYQPSNPLHSQLVLKGGNCFRKAYFEHARFSNDIDFSTQTELSEDVLRQAITQACSFAGELSGVEFHPEDNRIGMKNSADSDITIYEARVYFKSFYGEENVIIKVKLDISEFERIFLPIQTRKLIHAYSDANICNAELRCFKLEELLASKLKALLHRRHSPDLYDFVYSIFFQKVLNIRRLEVITTFLKKTIYERDPYAAKGLLLDIPFKILKDLWNEYLVCPKISLIDFDDAEIWFKTTIGELFSLLAPPRPAYAGIGGIGQNYFSSSRREVIMEAGRLQRVLCIVYDGYERRVEPYSLVFKTRQDGVANEYFYAWDLTGGRSRHTGIKSFLSNKIQSISLTDETFSPQFPIELFKSGGGYFSKSFSSRPRSVTTRLKPKGTKSLVRKSRPKAFSFGITYTVECPYCGKRFKRSKLDTRLNKHKDKFGNQCYGRIGVIV